MAPAILNEMAKDITFRSFKTQPSTTSNNFEPYGSMNSLSLCFTSDQLAVFLLSINMFVLDDFQRSTEFQWQIAFHLCLFTLYY